MDIYPLTIVANRYAHSVPSLGEFDKFLAFNKEPWEVPEGINGGDEEHWDATCDDAPTVFGFGATPEAAIEDLRKKLTKE